MRILFVTDLHGNISKYRRVFEAAIKHRVAAVVNGGDMLTLDGDLHGSQREFIKGFLSSYFAGYEEAGICHIGLLGNDDLRVHDDVFDETCRKSRNVVSLAQRRFAVHGFEFIGMNWVADYPFRLKDRCRRDGPGYVFQAQLGSGLLSIPEGFKELHDWPAYAAKLPSIEEELAALPKPAAAAGRTIYVIHTPPFGLGLDVVGSGEKVGSRAVTRFIGKMKPLLTMHGHIHESPAISGIWKAKIGETVCLQPGQMTSGTLSYALIDLKNMEAERMEESL